jgi:hypothetical protein
MYYSPSFETLYIKKNTKNFTNLIWVSDILMFIISSTKTLHKKELSDKEAVWNYL